mmetsp:Transcript_109377/g.316163  ORF Transcript_109377/g.316163 Transcript_109377/m.316163 type:complete len:301 (-) Transcript_109377:404-1306(-)
MAGGPCEVARPGAIPGLALPRHSLQFCGRLRLERRACPRHGGAVVVRRRVVLEPRFPRHGARGALGLRGFPVIARGPFGGERQSGGSIPPPLLSELVAVVALGPPSCLVAGPFGRPLGRPHRRGALRPWCPPCGADPPPRRGRRVPPHRAALKGAARPQDHLRLGLAPSHRGRLRLRARGRGPLLLVHAGGGAAAPVDGRRRGAHPRLVPVRALPPRLLLRRGRLRHLVPGNGHRGRLGARRAAGHGSAPLGSTDLSRRLRLCSAQPLATHRLRGARLPLRWPESSGPCRGGRGCLRRGP